MPTQGRGHKNTPVHGPGPQRVKPKTGNPDQQSNPPQQPQQNRKPGQQPNTATEQGEADGESDAAAKPVAKVIEVGQVVNVSAPEHVAEGLDNGRQKARIIAITDEPGKQVGVEFSEKVGVHSCDGVGKHGYCLWVRFDQVLSDAEYESKMAAKGRRQRSGKFSSVSVEPDGRGGLKAAFLGGSQTRS